MGIYNFAYIDLTPEAQRDVDQAVHEFLVHNKKAGLGVVPLVDHSDLAERLLENQKYDWRPKDPNHTERVTINAKPFREVIKILKAVSAGGEFTKPIEYAGDGVEVSK